VYKRLWMILVLSGGFCCPSIYAADYAGNSSCAACHENEVQQLMVSDHYRSMQVASPASVLGNFSDITVNFHNIESRFFIRGDEFFVTTVGDDGESQTFPIKYTFGYSPLQQYLVELDNGHVQALNVAWDSRPQNDGGQRWFHLQPDEDITPEHPFFWTNHFQNWNSRCAECHSTDLQRNYDPVSLSYDTQWSEINVACEACHGPGSDHVSMARSGSFSGSLKGFEKDLSDNSQFVFEGDAVIAKNTNGTSVEQLNTCAVCHSRRGIIGGYEAQKDYHEQFQLSPLNQGLYFADGQIDDEVFVFGSFLQSKMYAAGVTCTDCHNPHSTQLKAPGNALCQQCHRSDNYQTTEHHRHSPDSAGSQCVSCHMPQRTYMQVDARRDHSFSIPRPALANRVGAPNACANCHENWDPSQVVANYVGLFGRESTSPWADANHEARNLNILALPNILAIADDTSVAPIRRASLLLQAANYPARITVESIQKNLQDSEPLVRRAAVDATAFLAPDGRLQLLNPLIDDEVKSVRMAVANQLADSFASASENDRPRLLRLFEEYEQSLLLIQDTPGGQMNLAGFFYRRGNPIRVERAYRRALEIEPRFVPVLLNLSDLRREEGNEAEAENLLLRALEVAPDSGAVHHALGLLYVRTSQLPVALDEFKLATELADATPRFYYVYAIALESNAQKDAAIDVLKDSELQWPNQPESLMLLVNFLDQEGRGTELLPYLSSLSRILPGNQLVRALVAKYADIR